MKRIILVILFMIVTVSPVFAAWDDVIISRSAVYTTSGSPSISTVTFVNYAFTTTTSNSPQSGYLLTSGVQAWGYKDGTWTMLSVISPDIRWTAAGYSQLATLWSNNSTYDPSLGSPPQQFPDGFSPYVPDPAAPPTSSDFSKIFSFFLGGLTGLAFVMASGTRW